jgi:hypothetical protein
MVLPLVINQAHTPRYGPGGSGIGVSLVGNLQIGYQRNVCPGRRPLQRTGRSSLAISLLDHSTRFVILLRAVYR